jgi:ElaB/YqjD/DUF883 family membrane-anchored ribosome-binding protein
MAFVDHHSNSPTTASRGVATLELVLCLPILLVLIVGIVWLGNSVIAQTAVIIDARHQTWQQRGNPTGTALLFLKDDIVSEESMGEVNVSPLFDDMDAPESSHDVMAAVWDSEQLPLDQVPNWKQYLVAAANAKTAGLQNGYVDARNQLNGFKNSASNIWKTIATNLIRDLTNLGDSAKSLLGNAESSESSKQQQAKNRIKRELETKRAQLKAARQERRELDEDASQALRDVLDNRIDRLQAEVDDLKSDLEAIDG